jgi:DNA-binding CsgD family transcriptional regulator
MAGPDLQERIAAKIKAVASVADNIPGVIIIHKLPDFAVQYMSKAGLVGIGLTEDEIFNMGNQEYHERFFNPEDAQDYVPKIISLLEENREETLTFFQQVRTAKDSDWEWYHSAIKIFMRNESGRPVLSITHAMKIDPEHSVSSKVSRLLEENNFLRKHYTQFSKLSKREQEVLKLLALGKTSSETSSILFISPATVETHRKNIKRKLDITTTYQISQYARAFDLI